MQDYPIDSEGLSQTNKTVFNIAQPAVNLAVSILRNESASLDQSTVDQAKEIVYKYGDWANIPIPSYYKLEMMKRDFGDDEAHATLVEQYPVNTWFTVEDIAEKDDRELYKYLCNLEDERHVREDGAMLVSSMTGEMFMWERR